MAGRLGGRAKAMVVTTGRQHALDLYQAIRKWDDEPARLRLRRARRVLRDAEGRAH